MHTSVIIVGGIMLSISLGRIIYALYLLGKEIKNGRKS